MAPRDKGKRAKEVVAGEGRPGDAALKDVASQGLGWVSHIRFYEDYLTVIELGDDTTPDMRSAS